MFFDELNAREFYIRKSAKNNEILSLDELKVNGTKKVILKKDLGIFTMK